MKAMVKYTRILFLCILTIGGSSCDTDDDDIIYDSIIGETWLGDLGFSDRYDYPLESGLYFEGNGLGHDDQVYYDDPTGKVVFSLPFRWEIWGGMLRIDYGVDYPLFEIRNVYVTRDRLSGALYVDGEYDGEIILKRYY